MVLATCLRRHHASYPATDSTGPMPQSLIAILWLCVPLTFVAQSLAVFALFSHFGMFLLSEAYGSRRCCEARHECYVDSYDGVLGSQTPSLCRREGWRRAPTRRFTTSQPASLVLECRTAASSRFCSIPTSLGQMLSRECDLVGPLAQQPELISIEAFVNPTGQVDSQDFPTSGIHGFLLRSAPW